ncbi:MAG: hypothetical protein EBQ80_01685, partial [Proteobacteria bacterium]|nr:hypothetical protein [Pseudomonadota bacterium]
ALYGGSGANRALMPKLSDPLGIMSKISGLDGAAKQAAEAGINAALTAAGTAALPFAGAITSALGNKYGNWARDLAKKGTDAAGLTDGKSKVDSQNGQLEQTKKPEELEALLAGEYGETMEERIKREKAPYANYDATDFTGYPENLTDEENLKRSRERIEAEEMDKNYGPVIPQATDGKVAADGKIAAQVAEDAKNASSKPAGVKLEGVAPDAVVGTKNQKMGINDKPAVVAATDTRAAGTTTGAAAQVAQQADSNNNAAQRTMNQAAANQEAERIAREQKMETGTVFKHNGQTYQVAKDGTVSVAAINPNAQAGAGGAAGGETTVQQTTVLAQEQRLIDELSNLANVLNKASTTEKDSVIGAVMGRQQQAANELDEATEARHAQRKGPDVRISTGQALASGFYGGFEAIFKSAGNIPVIGQILRETSNEWYQGEARARAWNAAGGYKEWKALKSDGQRGKMLKQELGELQPGIEYREMMSVGGYHETYLQGAQAASENAARIQSSYRARQVVADKSADFQGKLVLSAQDLKGIGMADAMNKIASVRTEAAMMQGPGFDTKVATVNPDGSVKFDTVQIKYTPSVFQNWASNAAMSGLIKNMENNNVQQMKVIEKQFFRDGKFDAARATAGSFKAQAQYMRLDPEDSYIDSGELAVREGKIGFMGARGQAHAIRRYLKDQTRNTDEYIESAIKEGLGEFAKVNTEEYKRATRGLSSENLAAYNRKIFGSAAKKALLDSDPGKLPLEAVFDQAYKSAYYGFEQKSLLAVFAKEAEAEVNVGKIISSSRSAAGAKLPLPPNVYQRRRVESKNGSILDVGAVWDELVEKISIATDNDTLLTTSLVQQFMKELEAEGDKNALTSEIRQDKNKRQIVQTMSENSLARLTAVIQRGVTDVAQKDKILSKLNTKLRRDVTGRLVVQIGEIDIDTGNEEKGDGVTPLVPGANTPPPAGTSTGGRPAGGNPQPSFRERAKNFPGVNRPKRT